MLTEWIKNAIKKFKCHVVFSGGVSMNIKANMKIHEIPSVKEFLFAEVEVMSLYLQVPFMNLIFYITKIKENLMFSCHHIVENRIRVKRYHLG